MEPSRGLETVSTKICVTAPPQSATGGSRHPTSLVDGLQQSQHQARRQVNNTGSSPKSAGHSPVRSHHRASVPHTPPHSADDQRQTVGNTFFADDTKYQSDRGRKAVDNDDRPCFLPLCTKCDHEHKHDKHDHKEHKLASPKDMGGVVGAGKTLSPLPGFIIASQSFQEGSSQLTADAAAKSSVTESLVEAESKRRGSFCGGSSPSGRTFFHRSSIVKEEILTDGSCIGDFYDINVGTLGKGSYGSVVKAKDLKTSVIRAVKMVYKPKIENITRLKREILIMKRLDHPNIIKLFEVYEDSKNLYLVLELCTGGELFDRIIKSGHFSERYAASLMKQVFSAISYCHSNDIMHRDLKPENLLYADPSPLSALKVIDWGFAAKCGKNHKFTSVVGTPYYVAPEVLFGNYDKQCDLWSAGVILYILLCGYPPFHGKDNKEILRKVKIGEFSFDPRHWKKVNDHAKELVKRLLTYDPRKRMTATEALQHPWLQYYTQASLANDSPLSNKLGGDLLEKFKSFQRFNKMKKLAITCVAYQMSEREIGTLHDIFSALDKNSDGVLTVTEVSQALQNMSVNVDEIQGILQELDTDGNGTIDYTEFIAASIDQKLYEQESVCKSAFRVFDLDGDGKITIDEMHHVLEMNFVREHFTREMIEEMVKEVDTNNDGSIDFEEFMKMMRGSQKKRYETSSSPFSRARALLYRKLE